MPPPDASRPRTPHCPSRQRWPFVAGLALSALFHLVILLISPRYVRFMPPAVQTTSASVAPQAVMRVVAIAPVAEGASRVAELLDRSEPRRVLPETLRPGRRAGEPAGDAEPGARSAADRLRTGFRDPRLGAVPDPLARAEKSDAERAGERISTRLEEVNDSIRLAREAAQRAVDWTVRDDGGKSWGISRSCIQLGGIKIPLVVQAGRPLCQGDAPPDYLREWNASRTQADQAQAREQFNERARAMRERKELERARKNGGSN